MPIVTRDEIVSRLSGIIGERNDDDAISFIEDLTNTLDDYETRVSDSTDWKSKYEENDTAWREKYKSAFFEGVPEQNDRDDVEDETDEISIKTYDELFK